MKKIKIIIVFGFFLLYAGCSSLSNAVIQSKKNTAGDTVALPPPFKYRQYKKQNLIYHMLTINLQDPHIAITGTPPVYSKNSILLYDTIAIPINRFAKQTKSVIALNTSPFSYPFGLLSPKRNIVGLYIHEGKIISQGQKGYAALIFARNKQAFIIDDQINTLPKDTWFAFGGFWTILNNKTIYSFKQIKNSRTAVGISKDGFTLYVLIVEKSLHSKGLSFSDCAKILCNMGAYKAMQFDGGNSTQFLINKKILYRPALWRKNANYLGIQYNPD